MSEIISLLKRESRLQKELESSSAGGFRLKEYSSSKCAVIVEPRNHEMLEPVIRNIMPRLNKNWEFDKKENNKWNLHIFCGNQNHELVKSLLPNWKYKITNMEVDDLTREEYSSMLMNRDFWEKIDAEDILIFQTDCAIFNGFDIDHWLDKGYGYIGAAYSWGPRDEDGNLIRDSICPPGKWFNMNGGFSLRKKSAMLKCIEEVTLQDIIKHRKENDLDTSYFEQVSGDPFKEGLDIEKSIKFLAQSESVHEDTFFDAALSVLNMDTELCDKDSFEFAYQHKYSDASLDAKAIHAYESYCTDEDQRFFCRNHQGHKPKLLFYAGYGYEPFNGEDYSGKKGVRGSEIALVKIAEQLTSYYDVYISGPCISNNIYNNVSYFNSGEGKLQWFLDNVDIHTVIVNRYIHFFVDYTSRAKKHFVWLHDMCYQPFWNGQEFPELGKHLINNLLDKINGFICLSDWHINNIKDLYNIPDEKIYKIGNGIDAEMFKINTPKVENRFIYSSLPERGLEILLDWFPDIVKDLPDAELHVFTDNVDERLEANMKATENVYFHGKVSYEDIISEFMKADVWLYPNTFLETFCTSALEAQASNCICATRDYGSLGEVVGARGIVVDGDPGSKEFKEKIIEKLLNVLKDRKEKEKLQNDAKKWALSNSWENRGVEWVKILTKFPN
jgi:glycosyltransferase involved in cell wall biosynthesis